MRTQQIPEELQELVALIEEQDLILAEVNLPDVTAMPNYRQVLRVQDNNIVLSHEFLKITPKRILICKTSDTELDLGLPVPLWEKNGSDVAALVNEDGSRILVPTTYTQEVQVEVSPAEFDEDGHMVTEPVYEMQTQEVETKMEPVLVPVLKYLMFIISQKKYKEVFQMFTQQYIADTIEADPTFYTRLK